MVVDNSFHNRKSQTGPFRFGGKVGLKDSSFNLFGHSWAIILDFDHGHLQLLMIMGLQFDILLLDLKRKRLRAATALSKRLMITRLI